MSAMVDVLRQVPYFAELEAGLLRELTGKVRERKYNAGEVVQRALKVLEKDGAIRMECARVLILDPKALERWSEFRSHTP
jgi:hypothetical protein